MIIRCPAALNTVGFQTENPLFDCVTGVLTEPVNALERDEDGDGIWPAFA